MALTSSAVGRVSRFIVSSLQSFPFYHDTPGAYPCTFRTSTRTGAWPNVRVLPDVLCKRRGILYFAGEPARIIRPDTLKGGNVRVPILLRRRLSTDSGASNVPLGRTVPYRT